MSFTFSSTPVLYSSHFSGSEQSTAVMNKCGIKELDPQVLNGKDAGLSAALAANELKTISRGMQLA